MKTLVRILWILGAYWLASTSAAATAILFKSFRDLAAKSQGAGSAELGAMVGLSLVGGPLVGIAAVIPAAIVIGWGEATGIRRWYFYLVGGGLAAAVLFALNPTPFPPPASSNVPVLLNSKGFILTISGCVAGLVYWAIAGRHATGFLARRF